MMICCKRRESTIEGSRKNIRCSGWLFHLLQGAWDLLGRLACFARANYDWLGALLARQMRKEVGMEELGHAEGPIRVSGRLQMRVLVMYLEHDVL